MRPSNGLFIWEFLFILSHCLYIPCRVSADTQLHMNNLGRKPTDGQERHPGRGNPSIIQRRAIDDFTSRSEADLHRLHAENMINKLVYSEHKRRHAESLAHAGIDVEAMPDHAREGLIRVLEIDSALKHSLLGWNHASKDLDEHSQLIEKIEEAMRQRGHPIPSMARPLPEHELVPVSDFRLRRQESRDNVLRPVQRRLHTVTLPLERSHGYQGEENERLRVGSAWTVAIPVSTFRPFEMERQRSRER